MCHYLGLPVALELKVSSRAYSWSNDAHRRMRDYQVARGFDPTTIDFAQSLGYPAYKLIENDSDRFEEVFRIACEAGKVLHEEMRNAIKARTGALARAMGEGHTAGTPSNRDADDDFEMGDD